jgi:hypothetical protein
MTEPTGPTQPFSRMTRRTVMQAAGATTAVVALGSSTRFVSPALAVVSRTHLRRSSYASLVGSDFTITGADGATVALRLAEIADLARATSEPQYAGHDDVFALLFTGPRATVLLQGTHAVRHATLGTFSLFMVPVGGGSAAQLYEVVVDRSVPVAEAAETAPEPMAQTNDPARPAETAPVAAAVPVSAADGTDAVAFEPDEKAKESKKPKKTAPRKVLAATLARRGGVLSADIRVARGQGIVSVRASLLRDGVVLASAGRRLKGRFGVRVPLPTRRRVPRGDYTLRITTTDRRGRRATTRRRVTL